MRVHFADGRVEHADLLVGGDGIRSAVRAQVAPEVQPIYAGYYIWRGAPNEADLAPATLREHLSLLRVLPAERQQVIGYPISGFNNDLRPGHRRYNFIWYRVGDAPDAQGDVRRRERPPARILGAAAAHPQGPDRADARRGREHHAARLLDCLRNIEQPFFTPIYDFSAPRIVFGRVALVGDAGSSTRARIWASASPRPAATRRRSRDALRDHDDIDTALAAYNAARQPIGESIVLHGRKLGTHLGVDLKTEEDRRMWKLLQERRRHDGLDRRAEFPGCLSMSVDLPKPDYARNMRLVGHCDQGGRPDGVQIMVHRGHAYIGHMFSKGFSVIDVRDPQESARGELSRGAARAPGTSTCRPMTICCWSSTPRTCSPRPSSPTSAPITAASSAASSARREATASQRATGPRGSRSTTSRSRRRRGASASCRSTAAASTASGTPADAGPMCRRCSTASPTTSS